MAPPGAARHDRPVTTFWLWFGALGAPFFWALHILLRFPLVPVACAAGALWPLHLVTVACLAGAMLAGVIALRNARRARAASDTLARDSARFMGWFGVAMTGLFVLVILAEVLPTLFQSPCLNIDGPTVLLRAPILLLAPLLYPRTAAAGPAGGALDPDALWGAWPDEPLVLLGILAAAAVHARGTSAVWRRAGVGRGIRPWQAASFGAGLLVVAAALLSPFATLAEALFSAHMVQHLALIAVAAPLLVLGAPLAACAWAAGPAWSLRLRRAHRRAPGLRALTHALTRPLPAVLLHMAAVWAWHAPGPYTAALESDLAHALEHATFLGTALLFWWALLRAGSPRGAAHGAGVLCAFVMVLQCGALGGLLASAKVAFYPVHAAGSAALGLDLLDDQRLAGVIMWVPGGSAYVIVALVLFARWMAASERAARLARKDMQCSA